jgi:hypothetical protein
MHLGLVLILILAARAEAQPGNPGRPNFDPPPRPPRYEDVAPNTGKDVKKLFGCVCTIMTALMGAGGAVGASRGARAFRSNSRVVREDPQVRKSDPGPGLFDTPPAPSTAVTDKPDAFGFTVTPSPKENRDEASHLSRQMVLSNQLGVDELIDCLGKPNETFRPCLVTTVGCVVISAAFIVMGTVGGVATIQWTLTDQPNRTSLPLGMAIAFCVPLAALILGGVWLFVWAIRRFSYRLLVCPAGIIQVYRRKAAGAYWDQISAVDLTETTKEDGWTDRQCVVHREDGFKFVFQRDYPKRSGKLVKMIASHVRM